MIQVSPVKILVVLLVALILLGPDKVPQVARQIGGAWSAFKNFRERIETEVRDTVPGMPSTHEIVQAVRSPASFLDRLAQDHEAEQGERADPYDEALPDGSSGVPRPPPEDDFVARMDGGLAGTPEEQAAARQGAQQEAAQQGLAQQYDEGLDNAFAGGAVNGGAANGSPANRARPDQPADGSGALAGDPAGGPAADQDPLWFGSANGRRIRVPDDPSMN